MADKQKMDYFVLPRQDWYDEKGRINKDALIENFNALEEIFNKLAALDVSEDEVVDTTTIEYDDVTLDDDDDKIVNLGSFMKIFKIANFPTNLKITGTKIDEIVYRTEDGKRHKLTNIDTGATSSNKYVYLNYVDNKIVASSNPELTDNITCIGIYSDGSVRGLYSNFYCDINYLQYLSRMNSESRDIYFAKGSRDKYSVYEGVLNNAGNRTIGCGDTNKKTPGGWAFTATFRDVGRTARNRDEF